MMQERGGFSFSSLVTGYFMVAGGITLALIALQTLAPQFPALRGDFAFYGLFFVGGFLGAFFAARASRGETILEPAIGAVLVVATFVGLSLSTELGKTLFNLARERMTQMVAIAGGCAAVGAIAGAFISEKLLGEATRSALPWVWYIGLAVLGGCFIATLAAATILSGSQAASDDKKFTLLAAGIGAGCLLSGIAAGASSRTRVLAASFLGAVLGTFGFVMLVLVALTKLSSVDDQFYASTAVFAAGGGIVTVLGTAIGWVTVGRKHAG
jgi:hypothetical protein